MKYSIAAILLFLFLSCNERDPIDQKVYSGNPVFPGWYADPEGIIFDDTYWIYPTFSDYSNTWDTVSGLSEAQLALRKNAINEQYLEQTFFDAFSSKDLVSWQKHPRVLDIRNIGWAAYSLWAPSIIRANGKYFLFYSANDIQGNDEPGGIGVAVSDEPGGPFTDALGKPLINAFHHGAQPIDQFVFRDDDGQHYLYYGGWQHCNVIKLGNDLLSIDTFADGTQFREITPEQYVEGPFIFKRKGRYYFMWSEGGWMGPDYSVAYAIGDTPTGPFERIGKILQQDSTIATGAGHHSVISIQGTDEHDIVYHRRPLDTDNPHHRQTCIDQLTFDADGYIQPVKMTFEGVPKRELTNE